MTRAPYPGDINRETGAKTRARGMGYKFELTKPIRFIILALILGLATFQTFVRASSECSLLEIAVLFALRLGLVAVYAVVLLIFIYVFFAPYKLYDGIARLFDRKRK